MPQTVKFRRGRYGYTVSWDAPNDLDRECAGLNCTECLEGPCGKCGDSGCNLSFPDPRITFDNRIRDLRALSLFDAFPNEILEVIVNFEGPFKIKGSLGCPLIRLKCGHLMHKHCAGAMHRCVGQAPFEDTVISYPKRAFNEVVWDGETDGIEMSVERQIIEK